LPPDDQEPKRLAEAVKAMRLKYVVITSVTRDDLEDGGAEHFSRCVTEIKRVSPETAVELLTPDFKACQEKAVSVLAELPLAVFNHNIETVPRLYSEVRKGADFRRSLSLLKQFSVARPDVPTKSGLMLGVGETDDEVMEVLHHLREQGCVMLTIGQYLAPSRLHWPVSRYVSPDAFAEWKTKALEMGFAQVTSGPLVRSSYHAAESHEAVDTL
jgi:lipoic acid synthetase